MGERIVKISRQRRLIGENLKQSVQKYPQTRGFVNVDMSALLALKEKLAAEDAAVSVTAFFVKAIAMALLKHPELNARMEEDHFIYYDDVNVGVAMNGRRGLLVPVISKVNEKSLQEITAELKSLQSSIQDNTITIDAFRGGTVTLSSVPKGRMDSIISIVNNDEALIMGVGRTRKMPIVDENDNIVVRPVCTISINLNHYIADGAPQAAYSETFCEMLEHPAEYLL